MAGPVLETPATHQLEVPATEARFSPVPLLFITITSIFVAEILAMLLVFFLPSGPYLVTAMTDAAIMVVLIFPVLYIFSFRPLVQHIRKLQEVQRTLHKEVALQERYFDSIHVMIAYMDRDFNFIKVNDAFASYGEGRSPEFFAGKNYFALFPWAQNLEKFRRVAETGEPYSVLEQPVENSNGRGITYWSWNLQPVTDGEGKVEGVVLSLMDVSERKLVEEKVELERARLRSILDTIPDGVYIVDQNYEMEYANPVIERAYGPVGDQKCYSYLHDRSEACPWCKNDLVFEGRSTEWEWTSPRNGRIYEVFDMPLSNADGSLSKLKLIHDITSRKQAEDELERRNRELQSMTLAERRQREVADTLREAVEALSQSLELDVVLHTLLTHLRALVLSDTATIIFPESETLVGIRAADGYEKWADTDQVLSIRVEGENNPYFRRMLADRRSLLIADTARDPDWIVYPGNEPIRSQLFVPILIEDRLAGAVGLGKKEPNSFAQDQLKWAEALVGEAAVAIQNAWLYEQVRAGRERLQTLSRRLVEVQEQERVYIARELHDQASQTLTSLILGLGTLEREPGTPGSMRPKIAGLKEMTDRVLGDLHRLAINLRPASLDHLGLAPALEQLVKSFGQETHLAIRLKTVGLGEADRLPQETDTALYRIVQEALTNVVRHSRATHIDVVLERRDDSMLIIVEDDGEGFDVNVPRDDGHLGLLGMQERTEVLGGSLIVESAPGRGTTVVVEVPYADAHIAG
jgi:PAS domain S-box-containing protein